MAQDYVDDSNPFSRSGDEVELRREYGSKGRTIEGPGAYEMTGGMGDEDSPGGSSVDGDDFNVSPGMPSKRSDWNS